ncbi:MAG: hypothetical protein NVS3B14_18200 [Ktedonobacteraceae bacterium]
MINEQTYKHRYHSTERREYHIPFHVALSVIVLQVFRRNNIGWLWLAILAHAALDFISVVILQIFGKSVGISLLVELIVALAGMGGSWVIWRLRDQPGATGVSPAREATGGTSSF